MPRLKTSVANSKEDANCTRPAADPVKGECVDERQTAPFSGTGDVPFGSNRVTEQVDAGRRRYPARVICACGRREPLAAQANSAVEVR